jgi:DNA-binding MarR family transcriptional regulator
MRLASKLNPEIFDQIKHDQVRGQIQLARNEHGPNFDPAPLAILVLLNRAAAACRAAVSYELEEVHLTSTSFNILMVLHRSTTPVSMRTVSSAVSVKPPNLSIAVRDLVSRGLVQRTAANKDKRTQMVEISAEGEAILRPLIKRHFSFIEELFAEVDDVARVNLIETLDTILVSLTDDGNERNLNRRIIELADRMKSLD